MRLRTLIATTIVTIAGLGIIWGLSDKEAPRNAWRAPSVSPSIWAMNANCLTLAGKACNALPWVNASATHWLGAQLDTRDGNSTITITRDCVIWEGDTTYAVCPTGIAVS